MAKEIHVTYCGILERPYSQRQIVDRRPGHSTAVILCLAAGLTVSITTFSIVTSLLYGDQPGIANRTRLVRTYMSYDAGGQHVSVNPLSRGDFDVLRNAGNALGSLAAEGDILMAAVGRHDAIGLTGAFVSGNYFEVLGTIPHLGRVLTPDDERDDASRVAVVSEHFWRTQLDASIDSIGKQILLAGRSFVVVGVAPRRFHGIHPLELGEDTYLSDTGGLRYLALSVGGLGLLALSLAAMGLYAIMAYLVMLRRREIGIRMAVGADPSRILSMVLREAFNLVLTGSAIGLALAIPLAFGLRAVFVGTVTPLDPVALVPTFALMMLVGLLAAAIPAGRAARVDPMQTLKEN